MIVFAACNDLETLALLDAVAKCSFFFLSVEGIYQDTF